MEARLKAILEMDASQLNKELVDIGKEMGKFEKELSKSKDTSEIEAITAKIAQLEKAMALVIGTMNKVGNGMADVGARVAKVENDFTGTNKGADLLAKSMIQLDASVNRVGLKLDALTPSIGKVGATAAATATNVSAVAVSSAKAAKATEAVGGAMKSSTMNGQNFARVIQDLPFGFMGIQNNLTQLIPGIGAAGIAFSALTAAITFSQVGLQYWGRSAKQAKEQADEFLEFSKELNKNIGEEVTKAKLLYEASNNVALSMDKRIRAATELKDLYPELLKGYSAEDIALGKAADKYALLTTEIIKNARAKAAAAKIGEIEGKILDEEQKIAQLMAEAEKKKQAQTPTVITGTMGAPTKLISIADKQLNIELKVKKDIADVEKTITEYKKQQAFYTNIAGGATGLQGGIVPPPPPPKKTGGSTTAPKDSALAGMIATSNDFQQKKGKWWRNTQTERGNDLSATPNIKVRIEENAALNKILIEQAEVQKMLNDQLAGAAAIAEYGGQVFGQMVAAMMNGESIGDVLANAFKQIAIQIAAAVAQALIFSALLEAFPALKGVFGAVGAVSGIGGGGGGNIGGRVYGMDIQLSQRRTSTGMGFRRGRR